MAKSKKYKDASARYDKQALHEPAEAFELVKSMATKKFDETVEAAFRLGVDPRKADQMLRGTVSLPAGTGKDVRVAVFAAGDAAEAARGGRRRCRRCRRPREPRAERGLHGLRHRDRDPRPHGSGRSPRSRARAAGPHAEPEDRHRHDRCRQGCRPSSRAARSSTGPIATATCTCRWARRASRSRAWCGTTRAVLDELQRARPASAKGRYLKGVVDVVDDGPGREDLARLPRRGLSRLPNPTGAPFGARS